jgi:hypothetical protein
MAVRQLLRANTSTCVAYLHTSVLVAKAPASVEESSQGAAQQRKLRLRASLSTVTLPARKSPEQLWDYVGCVEPPPPAA